jgi:hypothetical protein
VIPTSGEGGIRTPDAGITDITVFETAAFNHSATSPRKSVPSASTPFNYHCTTARILHKHASQREANATFFYINYRFTLTSSTECDLKTNVLQEICALGIRSLDIEQKERA